MKPFHASWNEKEPTCPGGGSMRWVVEVEEPDREIGAVSAMISITETATNTTHGQDVLLLGVDDAERLITVLTLAVAAAKAAEAKAREEAAVVE